MKESWEKIKKKCWPPGKDQLLIAVLVGLLLAVVAIPAEEKKPEAEEMSGEPEAETGAALPEGDYESRMEQKLEELLSQVEGVGQVRVMLTFEGTGEKLLEYDVMFFV